MSIRPLLAPSLSTSYTPLNPLAFLLKAASIRPSHVAISHPEANVQWTYSEWSVRVLNLAHALLAAGVKRGDRVLVAGPNCPWVADALQAVPAIGAIVVPIKSVLSGWWWGS